MANNGSPADNYIIVLSGGNDNNYTLNLVNGTLTIYTLKVEEESTAVVFKWVKEEDTETYVLIFYSDEAKMQEIACYEFDADGNLITKSGTCSYNVTGLDLETRYYFSLASYDQDGNEVTVSI